jgi:two-component system sensor histidine kinase PilS (NtrC family)
MVPGKISKRRLFHIITACRLLLFIFLLLFLICLPIPAVEICTNCQRLPMLLGAAFFLTSIYLLWHRKRGLQPGLLYLQTACDVVLAGATVHFTGGVSSPFTFFFAIAILTAALLGGRGVGMLSAVANTAIYFFVFYLSLRRGGDLAKLLYPFGMNLAAFNLVSAIGIYIAARLKKTEEELDRTAADLVLARRLQEHLAQSMNSGLLILDREGYVVFANRAAGKIINMESGPLAGKHILDVWGVHGEMVSRILVGYTERQEFKMETDSGMVAYIGIAGFPIYDNRSEAIGFGLIFQDITENKVRDEKLRRMDRLAALGEMAAGLAHEIRNPLASISGAAEFLLESDMTDNEGRKLVEIIKRESQRLEELTRSFLLYGKPQKRSMKEIMVRDEVIKICDLLKKRKRFADTVTDISIPVDAALFMDPNMFTQVVLNVILNAFQAVPADSGRIEVFSEEAGGFFYLKIRDNGRGISPENMDTIFNPFFTTRNEGTGLGLAIVYRIMNESGGSVSAESGKAGTVFTLKFPLRDRKQNH